MRVSCAQAGLKGFEKSPDDLLFNLENGSYCGWALVTKESRGRWGLSGDGKVAHSWVLAAGIRRGWEGSGLAFNTGSACGVAK